MRELSIESIRLSLMNYQRVVILREKDSDRYLPIWIGPAEAVKSLRMLKQTYQSSALAGSAGAGAATLD